MRREEDRTFTRQDIARLKTLLAYWIEHNQEHGRELREWAERLGDGGADLLAAAEEMERAGEYLARMARKLDSEEA